MKPRIVALVDMDCFYCQVEQRLNPELKGKPVAVVQYKKWRGGGIIAVNYEARKFGVTRNMRGDEAKAKCPDISLVRVPENREKADITKYRDAGREVIDIICQFSSCVERASIDEAYVDLSDAVEQRMLKNPDLPLADTLSSTFVVGYEPNKSNGDEEYDRALGVQSWLQSESLSDKQEDEEKVRLVVAAQIVEEMRAAVLNQTGFTCSAGIAHNKILSKLVCGLHKPARQTVLPPNQVSLLYETLPIQKVRSLGGKLGDNIIQKLGITVMADLARFSETELCQKFDQKTGSWLFHIARGVDNEPVNARLIPKSIGCCKRFPGSTALKSQQNVEYWISELAKEVSERLNKDLTENHRRARGLTVQWSLEIGGSSSSKTGVLSSYDASTIAAEAMHLLNKSNNAPIGLATWKPPLQFLGISVSKFSEEENKNTSIQNFFKSVDNSSNKACITVSENNKKSEENQIGTVNVEERNLKSFFCNYSKKSVTLFSNVSEASNKVASNEEIDDKRIDLYKTSLGVSNIDSPKKLNEKHEDSLLHSNIANKANSSANAFSTRAGGVESVLDETAPCPQCGKLNPISKMSEHLDLHIAEELHTQLNKESSRPLNNLISKKRKATSKSISNTKTKKIDSFFSRL